MQLQRLFAVMAILCCLCHTPAFAQPILIAQPPWYVFDAEESKAIMNIGNSGDAPLDWILATDQPWLSVNPFFGPDVAPQTFIEVDIELDRTGLADGVYEGTIFVISSVGREDCTVDNREVRCLTREVTMVVFNTPLLGIDPSSMTFTSVTTQLGLDVTNTGIETLEWNATVDQPWMSLAPASGSNRRNETTVVVITVDPDAAPPGNQFGNVTVTSNGGNQDVPVALIRTPSPIGGTIGLFSDPDGADCNIMDGTPGLLRIYVVHTNASAVSGSQWAAPAPMCMTGVSYIGDQNEFPVTIGNSQSGYVVGYGACLTTPILITTILYNSAGTSQTCCEYAAVPHPSEPLDRILAANCLDPPGVIFGNGFTSTVNPDGGCVCGAVVIEESTWGRVKSLYSTEN